MTDPTDTGQSDIDPFADVECDVEGCGYKAGPWSSSWAYHYMNKHSDLMVAVPISYAEDEGCDVCGARKALNGAFAGTFIHKGDCRG